MPEVANAETSTSRWSSSDDRARWRCGWVSWSSWWDCHWLLQLRESEGVILKYFLFFLHRCSYVLALRHPPRTGHGYLKTMEGRMLSFWIFLGSVWNFESDKWSYDLDKYIYKGQVLDQPSPVEMVFLSNSCPTCNEIGRECVNTCLRVDSWIYWYFILNLTYIC